MLVVTCIDGGANSNDGGGDKLTDIFTEVKVASRLFHRFSIYGKSILRLRTGHQNSPIAKTVLTFLSTKSYFQHGFFTCDRKVAEYMGFYSER